MYGSSSGVSRLKLDKLYEQVYRPAYTLPAYICGGGGGARVYLVVVSVGSDQIRLASLQTPAQIRLASD